MKTYVRRPTPIAAWQIDLLEVQHQGDYPDWVGEALKEGILEPYFATSMLSIYTPTGKVKAKEGDYLIQSAADGHYVISKEIFELTYESVTY